MPVTLLKSSAIREKMQAISTGKSSTILRKEIDVGKHQDI
jgi:hypothetical protein